MYVPLSSFPEISILPPQPNWSVGILTAFPVTESLPKTVSPEVGVFFVDNSKSIKAPTLSSVKTSCFSSNLSCNKTPSI